MARPRVYHTKEERHAAQKARTHRWYTANKEKMREQRAVRDKAEVASYNLEYRAKNKDALAAKSKARRETNREEYLAKKAAYRDKNREELAAKQRAYNAEHREERNAKARAYQKANKERRRLYREANKDRIKEMGRDWARLRHNQKREELAGYPRPAGCEACGQTNGKKALVFDHCHTNGHFRGWLCNGCNTALGHVRDDIQRLRKLIAYLRRNRTNTAPQLVLSGI